MEMALISAGPGRWQHRIGGTATVWCLSQAKLHNALTVSSPHFRHRQTRRTVVQLQVQPSCQIKPIYAERTTIRCKGRVPLSFHVGVDLHQQPNRSLRPAGPGALRIHPVVLRGFGRRRTRRARFMDLPYFILVRRTDSQVLWAGSFIRQGINSTVHNASGHVR